MEAWLDGMVFPSLAFCLWSFWCWRRCKKNRKAERELEWKMLEEEEEAFLKRPF